MSTKGNSVVKAVFLSRLYQYMLDGNTSGFIPDIYRISKTCDIRSHIDKYAYGRCVDSPTKQMWKNIVKEQMTSITVSNNLNNLRNKSDTSRFLRIMESTGHKSSLYRIANICKYQWDIRPLLTMIRLLSLPDTIPGCPQCVLCGKDMEDISTHIIMQCPVLYDERNRLCECIINIISVEESVVLFGKNDCEIVDIILGRKWSALKKDRICEFYRTISVILKDFVNPFQANIWWLRLN